MFVKKMQSFCLSKMFVKKWCLICLGFSIQGVQFQFLNTFKVEGKQVNWTYTHERNENRTVLDGTLLLDTTNKLSASHELGSVNCMLKYNYVHRGLTTFEPCYDLANKSWDLAVSRRVLLW